MDYYPYSPPRPTQNYPSYTSTSGFNSYDNSNGMNRDQRYTDSYGRSITNPLPAIFRTATIASNAPSTPTASSRGQPFSYRPASSNSTYDTPRNYAGGMSGGYISDSNDHRRSSAAMRPNVNNYQPPSYNPSPQYNTRLSTASIPNDQSYYSDSECVTAGPRYYKISRQSNAPRRPSNVVLPIRSMTSKAYDQYVPQETPKAPQQQPVDVYRYQQEQQRLERERQMHQQEQQRLERERQMYQQQQAAAARFRLPPQLTLPSQDQRRRSDGRNSSLVERSNVCPSGAIDRELGAELLKSPIPNSEFLLSDHRFPCFTGSTLEKIYGDSSFFKTPFNTYPTIEEQKKMARQIASILEGGDPSQKGATKFEKQRQRAEKYTLEGDSGQPSLNTSNYRPLRSLQTNDDVYSCDPKSPEIPACIKNSLDAAQHMNPLRYVGAPEEFKQMHMQVGTEFAQSVDQIEIDLQEHVTHTNVPPQAAMSLVADLNQNRGKGAAIFQKRKARSEKWVVDENNVKKSGYHPTSSYIDVRKSLYYRVRRHCLFSFPADDQTVGSSRSVLVVRR